ncbi:hypothetical protein Tco_1156871 [Tanacetum coccineum]
MSTQQDINAFRAQRIANTHDPLALMANTQTPCHPDHSSLITYMQHPQPNNNFVSQPSFNMNYLQHPMQNPGDISNPTTAFNMALALMAKAFTLNDTTPTNNNQRSSSNPSSMQIAQPGMNMDQDRQMLMVEDNVGNQFRPNAMQNVGNQVVLNASQNPGVQNVGNQNGLRKLRCICNCTLENNLQQASTSGTQSKKAPVYDSDGSAEVHLSETCYHNDIFNMFTQDEQYTDLLEHIPKPHQVQQNDKSFLSQAKLSETTKSLYNGKVLLEKHDPPAVHDSKETLQLAQESRLKMKQLNKEIKPENYTKIGHLLGVLFLNAKSQEEVYFSYLQNWHVSKSISIPIERFLDDTTPSVARKFINEEIERLLGDLCLIENENVELEFQVRNYEKEIAHLKTTYKNLFDSIKVTRTQTKAIIDSLQNKLHDTIYENAKLRAQLFDKVSEQVDTTKGTSTNTKFAKQSILGKPPSSSRPKLYVVTHLPNSTAFPKVGETNALSKPVTSNSVPSSRESTVVNNERVIAPGIFRINPFKATRVDNFVPNKHVKTSVRTKPIIVSQPHVITKNDVNSKTNGFSPKDIRSTTRTRRPKPWNNPKSDKVPFKSKSGCLSNKLEKIEENHRNNNPFFKEKGSVRFSALYLKKKRNLLVFTSRDMIVMTSMVELESLFGHLFDELSNGENQVVLKSSAVTTAMHPINVNNNKIQLHLLQL